MEFRHYPRSYPGVMGAYYTPAPPSDAQLKAGYAELSAQTRGVYLLPMVVRGDDVIGVICIDTYSPNTWSDATVQMLKSVANLGAVAITAMAAFTRGSEKTQGS